MKMLGSKVKTASTKRVKTLSTSTRRTTGRGLQARRKRIWAEDPTCKGCGRVVAYPHGFELDHIVPLWQGGPDTDDNCQVLCVWVDTDGEKKGCHADKTSKEESERAW